MDAFKHAKSSNNAANLAGLSSISSGDIGFANICYVDGNSCGLYDQDKRPYPAIDQDSTIDAGNAVGGRDTLIGTTNIPWGYLIPAP
jgi:hypothetical protein